MDAAEEIETDRDHSKIENINTFLKDAFKKAEEQCYNGSVIAWNFL